MAAPSTSARQSSGMSTNLVTRPSMKQSLLILPLVQRSTLLSSVHTWVRRLMMLAPVPTSDVPDVFNQLVENIPDTVQIDPLLGYFERTWIAGLNGRAARYPPASWNQTDRITVSPSTRLFLPLLDMLTQQFTTSCLPYTWSKHQLKARCTPTDVEYSHRSERGDIWRRILG